MSGLGGHRAAGPFLEARDLARRAGRADHHAGGVAGAVMQVLGNPTIPATLAGALALVVVSLLTPPKQRSFEEVAEAHDPRTAVHRRRMPRQPELTPAASSHSIQH